MKSLQFISALSICISLSGCAIIEMSPESKSEKVVAPYPVLASSADSSKVFNAKSAIQRSPEYILSSFTVFKDGKFTVEVSTEELKELGVSYADYLSYKERVSSVKVVSQ